MTLPIKLDHSVVHVSDWERSNAFYRDVLGAELVRRPSGWCYRFGDAQLNLHGPGFTPAEVARYWSGRALTWIAQHPGDWLVLVGEKLVTLEG